MEEVPKELFGLLVKRIRGEDLRALREVEDSQRLEARREILPRRGGRSMVMAMPPEDAREGISRVAL